MPDAEKGQTIHLKDYRPPEFRAHRVSMTVRLAERDARVSCEMELERAAGVPADRPLVLDGDELTLVSVSLGGEALSPERYVAGPQRLEIASVPADGRFVLGLETRLVPEDNTKLMGLYRSGGIWCTQCEAEGFRRITYFPDRPDVLALYRVRIEADRRAAPILLSNGNLVEEGVMDEGRHYAVWDDPFPKPSYLFALVAGDLDALRDGFTTASGREVTLNIYTEKGRAGQAEYAMDALKRSMLWDERRFGREYDLDVFNIVAISDFNMGAMENKGLNVFNHKYVLLDPQTATDIDYAGVETVIAHEYFHNWTGNRITCRDWFQLCLKEGLTVYRDQEFSAHERSATVQRIGSVKRLMTAQFPEDQGPLQHAVRPEQYREINNFYTATVYDKGAELVRMIATLLGADLFRKGMDLYFERHDGEATTIEAFLAVFAEVSGRDLSQFALWYAQAGTPELSIEESYDEASDSLTLHLRQSLARGSAGTGTAPMTIPIRFGLVGPNGEDRTPESGEGAGGLIELTQPEASVRFSGVGGRPYLSALRDFSAPVTLRHHQSEADRVALARLDPNLFNRWRVLADLVSQELQASSEARRTGEPKPFRPAVVTAMLASAADESLEPAFRAQVLMLPPDADIARAIAENVDPAAIRAAQDEAALAIGTACAAMFDAILSASRDGAPFSPDAASAGRRALALCALSYRSTATRDAGLAARRYETAGNMTDRLGALAVLVHRFAEDPRTEAALADFFARFETDDLVIDKWFAIQASAPREGVLDTVKALTRHPRYSPRNPNRARALLGTFAANQIAFHRADGAGHRFVAERLQEIDTLNPQVSARIATSFRSWRALEPGRRASAEGAIQSVLQNNKISVDLRDILERSAR